MRLAVVSHVPHWIGPDGQPWAYEPYVREARIWADLFSELLLCSPVGEGPMRGNAAPYERKNIEWHPVRYTLAYGRKAAMRRMSQLPGMTMAAYRAIVSSDFVHLRGPGHFDLVGGVLVRFLRRASLTKWSGCNGPFEGQRWTERFDRTFQGIPSRRNLVLVYGPEKARHQISFIPALMSAEEHALARHLAAGRVFLPPWRILCVARLEPEKNLELAISGLGELFRRRPDIPWTLTIIGDGTRKATLQELATIEGVAGRISFTGSLPFRGVQDQLASAHVLVMPGVVEGWGKVIAEAWAHGAIPVAASGGSVPWLLRDQTSGRITIPTPAGLAETLEDLLNDPAAMERMSSGLYRFAEALSLEAFSERLKEVLVTRCGLIEKGARDHGAA